MIYSDGDNNITLTSSECQDVADTQLFCPLQVSGDVSLGQAATRHMQHGFQTRVVQCRSYNTSELWYFTNIIM